MRLRAWVAAGAFAIVAAAPAHAAVLGLPDRPPGFVTDTADLLPAEAESSLESELSAFAASTSIEIAVVTVPSLQGDAIERVTLELFEAWKPGDEARDTGLLFLVSRDDREARIEVGYGLEGALPDSVAARILRDDVFPAFREDDYARGIEGGVARIQAVTRGEALPQETETGADSGGLWIALLFGAFFALQLLVSLLERSRSWWLGGVIGVVAGGAVTFWGILGIGLALGLALTAALGISGLVLDYVVSKGFVPGRRGTGGGRAPWLGGFGGSGRGGGGFGGFGGGSSGGGGASGSW